MNTQPARPELSAFAFKVGDQQVRDSLMLWWPSVVAGQQLKDHGPDQRGFLLDGKLLE